MNQHITVSAPGKVIFHGEHAVVYGKPAVAASLGMRTNIVIEHNDSMAVSFGFKEVGLQKTFLIDKMKQIMDKVPLVADYDDPTSATSDIIDALLAFVSDKNLSPNSKEALGAATFLYLYCSICRDISHQGLNIIVSSDIPVGAGFGSSAAFSTSVSAALLQFSGHIKAYKSEDKWSWSEQDKQIINKWAFVGEKIMHGQPSGIDNTVSTMGGAIKYVKDSKDPITVLSKMPKLSVMLVNTRVPRSTKALVEKFRKRCEKFQGPSEAVLQAMDAVTQHSLTTLDRLADQPYEPQYYATLGELVSMNHQLLCAMGVGHPALDTVVSVCARHGLPAKLTGAGGGGCAFALVPPDLAEDTLELVKQELEDHNFDVWLNVSIGEHGVCMDLNR